MEPNQNREPEQWPPKSPQPTFVPILDAKHASERKAAAANNLMVLGGLACAAGIVLTVLSGFQTLFWGAILFGGITFFAGLAQSSKVKRGS